MNKSVTIGILTLLVAAPLAMGRAPGPGQSPDMTLLDDPSENGFTRIFNGQDLAGWGGNPALWSVKDGALTGQTSAEHPIQGNTFLVWTNGEVGDFELRCSFRIVPMNSDGFANSGIQYRSVILDKANWVVGGYQADMEAGPTYTGILYEERMSRGIMASRGEKVVWDKDCKKQVTGSLGKSEDLQAAIRQGEWNNYVIIAKGNHLRHYINGHQTVDVIDDCESKRAMKGVLALQLHAGKPMLVQFRDIRLRVPAEGGASAIDLKRMQGAWRVASIESRGSLVPEENVTNIVVTVNGNNYEVSGGDITDKGTFTMDTSKSPRQMDIHPNSGPDSGVTIQAVYEVGAETMRVCYAREGASRPTSFKTTDDDRVLMIVYKR